MTAYVDSSVVLRVVLGQPWALREWDLVDRGVVSALVEVECLRTLDRLRLLQHIADREIAVRREAVFRLMESLEVVAPDRAVLSRASQPMPSSLGTLDAIHLATALLWQDRKGVSLVMATHDTALATAARASGLRTVGV
jgi:predicted nucleic acid-binding protein